MSLTGMCHKVLACPLNRGASLRSLALARLRVILYGCVAEWLALCCAALQMDAGTASATGLKIPSRTSSGPLHWEDEAHLHARGHRAKPFCTSITNANPNPLRSQCSSPSLSLSLNSLLFPHFYKKRQQAQPARIWSVAFGVLWSSLVK